MASLQKKNESWHLQFTYRGQRRTWVLGPVEDSEALATKGNVAYLLMRIKQRLLDVPPNMDIVTFLEYDGKPPQHNSNAQPNQISLSEFRDQCLKTVGNGALETNTLYTAKIHLRHLNATLGDAFPVNALTHADLQRHIDRRCGKPCFHTCATDESCSQAQQGWCFSAGSPTTFVVVPLRIRAPQYPERGKNAALAPLEHLCKTCKFLGVRS